MDAMMKKAADKLEGIGRNEAEAALETQHIVILASIYWLRTAFVKHVDRKLVIPLWLGAIAMTANAIGLRDMILRWLGFS